MSSGPAYQIGATSAPTFAQQGQVDWVAFGNTTWQITSGLLQRFANADIHTVTYGAALALGCRFSLSVQGRTRVVQALKQLSGTSAFQKVLWFGFGHKSFVDVITANEPGLQFVALCGCLTDTHGLDVAAYVLVELWKTCNHPAEYQPSHEQFVGLARACEGTLAATTFGQTVERHLGFGRLSIDVEEPEDAVDAEWKRSAKAEDIAQALTAIFKISNGELQRIKIVGRAEVAFMAAVATWLFDLNLRVVDGPDYTPQGQEPQVEIEYLSSSAERVGEVTSSAIAHVESQTYLLEGSGEFWSQLHSRDDISSSSLLIHRVPWVSCFYRTFGSRFSALSEMSVTLGDFLGSAARIFSAFSLCEPSIGVLEGYRRSWIDYSDLCHGEAFVAFIVSTFPELQAAPDLPELMHGAVDKTFHEALKSFQLSITSLRAHCGCGICLKRPGIAKTCLIGLATTILRVSQCLASTERDPALLLTISGLQHVYSEIRLHLFVHSSTDVANAKLLSIVLGSGLSIEKVLNLSLALFSGTRPLHNTVGSDTVSDRTTALS